MKHLRRLTLPNLTQSYVAVGDAFDYWFDNIKSHNRDLVIELYSVAQDRSKFNIKGLDGVFWVNGHISNRDSDGNQKFRYTFQRINENHIARSKPNSYRCRL